MTSLYARTHYCMGQRSRGYDEGQFSANLRRIAGQGVSDRSGAITPNGHIRTLARLARHSVEARIPLARPADQQSQTKI